MITFLLILVCYAKAKIISIKINGYDRYRPKISFSLPIERRDVDLYLNTFLPFSIFKFPYSSMKANRIISKETLHLDENYPSMLYYTDIMINEETTCTNFSLYNVKPSTTMYYKDKGLALGYHIKDESFSIVHQLYHKNIIEHLKFAFKNLKGKSDRFYIGGVPNNEHLNLPYKATIKVYETLPTWGFTIDKLIFNGTEYDIGIPAIISSASDSLWISDDLYKLFKDVILKEAIEERDCRLLYMEENEYIKCYQTVIGATYSLIINEHNFTFSSEIFDKNRYGIIKSNKNQHNHKAHNFTGIIIGPQFLSQFNYSIFDYEKKQVEFYSDTTIITFSSNKVGITKWLLCSECIIMLINILIIIYSNIILKIQ